MTWLAEGYVYMAFECLDHDLTGLLDSDDVSSPRCSPFLLAHALCSLPHPTMASTVFSVA